MKYEIISYNQPTQVGNIETKPKKMVNAIDRDVCSAPPK